MEPLQNYPFNYPVFEADQVLTNNDLNELFNYLDSQERLTRIRLIGMGIVCGLELRYDAANTAISISNGCGITSWGYLALQEDVTLKYYRNYVIPSTVPAEDQYAPFTLGAGKAALYELLSDEEYQAINDKSAITALSGAPQDFLQDKVVVLYLEMNADALKNCLTGDCDNKGIDMALTLKRLLIGKEDLLNGGRLERIGAVTSSDDLPDLFLPAVNVPATGLNDFNSIYDAYASIFSSGNGGNLIDQLSMALDRQYQFLSPLLPDFPTSPFTQVKPILQKRMDDIRKNIPWGIQYYYDFIDDLIKAYNELKNKARSLISECCPDDSKFPLHLKLGLAMINTAGQQAAFREYFIYSPLYHQQQELIEELRLLFARIKRMIDNFFVPNPSFTPVNTNLRIFFRPGAGSLPVRITPSATGIAPLSDRAIPYYYQVDNANPIQESWNYLKTRAGKASQNLSYNADKYNSLPAGQPFISPLLYSTEPYNFFRIEGHIGQNYTTVLKAITQQQNNYRLPFDVVALKLGTDASDIQPDITCSFSDLESQYDILKSEVFCRLGDQTCFYAAQTYSSRIPIRFGNLDLFTADFARNMGVTDMAAHFSNFNIAASQPLENTVLKADVLKFTTLLPVNLRPLFQFNVYVKGQFLTDRPCFADIQKPPTNTTDVGLAYLARIKQGAIPAYPPNDISLLPDYLLKMVDLIEDVVSTIYYTQLGYFNADDFNTKYQALTGYAASVLTLVKNSPNAANVPAGLTDYLSSVNACCDPAKLQALQQDYQKRFQNLQQSLLFGNFITQNPGIDHKAGVPKGGTFLLVYYEKPAQPSTNTGGFTNIRSALTANIRNPELLRSVITGGRPGFTSGFTGAVSGGTPPTEGIQPPDKAVVADFYLPYLCCSGCNCGITYILPAEPATGDLTISLQSTAFCNTDPHDYAVNVQPAGGAVTGDGVKAAADGSFSFTPNGLTAGDHVLTYTLGGKTATVTVTVAAQVDFSFTAQQTPGAAGITATFTPVAPANGQYLWNFGDGNTSDQFNPAHTYNFDGNSADFNVSFTVVNGPQPCNAVTKKITLTKAQQPVFILKPNRFAFNDTKAYPFTIVPPVKQQDILKQTTDPSKLANPDSLPLTVDTSGALTLTPSMPALTATLISTLRYQNISLPVTIVRPVAAFLLDVKNTAGAAGRTGRTLAAAFATTAAAAANPVTIGFAAKDTGADKYNWNVNGKDGILPATINPVIAYLDLVKKLGGNVEELTIILTISYTINNVTATDSKKAVLAITQLQKNLNKGPFEPAYV